MKSKKKPYLGIFAITAFASMICGAKINGDNGETILWVGAFGFGLTAALFIYLAIKTPKA